MAENNERYERGLAKLGEIDPQAAQRVIDSLAEIAPDFARYVVEFPFGDIFSRPGLDLRTRELITVAALTAMGHAAPQLRAHIQLALSAGCTKKEITETIIQMAVYAGFPAALNGLFLAQRSFRRSGWRRTSHAFEITGSGDSTIAPECTSRQSRSFAMSGRARDCLRVDATFTATSTVKLTVTLT